MASSLTHLSLIEQILPPQAMAVRGAFHPRPDDSAAGTGTLVLLGWTGGRQWPAFIASPEAGDGQPHPLDRWSRRLIDTAAAALGAVALYPFGGPPHHDFQRWALRAEPVARSPIGLLIHPRWGLWHAYRGALGFPQRLDLTELPSVAAPCDACTARPCLSACPVAAFSISTGYDVAGCGRHIATPAGQRCVTKGCAARLACPVPSEAPCHPAQVTFHMNAFARSLGGLEGAA